MKIHKVDFDNTGFFSSLFLDYVNQKDSLKEFYGRFPTPQNFIEQAKEKKFSSENRKTLHQVLLKQYEGLSIKPLLASNIQSLLDNNTFTITTGHQLNLFTGPLYFILKIVTIIDACRRLNQQQKEFNYVPVYWMASEDHDFAEINHFYLFNKKFVWESDQKGVVGEFSTEGIDKIFSEINDKLPLLEEAYLKQTNLSDATRYLVNELFGEYGLIIIDGNDRSLKLEFSSVIKDEIKNQTSCKLVNETSEKLRDKGYNVQVNPREINLFYKDKSIRERIVQEGVEYKVLGVEKKFDLSFLNALADKDPQFFSPNVILRPLYQEMILPNVAYCGGPGELAYWFQLKSVFNHYSIPFPILLPRMFGLIITKPNANRISKLNLGIEDLFMDDKLLKERLLSDVSDMQHDLTEEEHELDRFFDKIKTKASSIDPTLEGYVLAEKQKIIKSLEQIARRLKKAEEQKHETMLSQLSNLKSKLFPEGELQERRDNFLNFYISDPQFISKLFTCCDPFDFRFNVLTEDE